MEVDKFMCSAKTREGGLTHCLTASRIVVQPGIRQQWNICDAVARYLSNIVSSQFVCTPTHRFSKAMVLSQAACGFPEAKASWAVITS
jgi:hypothetical protein